MSPHTVTGAQTFTTLLSLLKTSFAFDKIFLQFHKGFLFQFQEESCIHTDILCFHLYQVFTIWSDFLSY